MLKRGVVFLLVIGIALFAGYKYTNSAAYIEKAIADELYVSGYQVTTELTELLSKENLTPSCVLAGKSLIRHPNVAVATYLLEENFDVENCFNEPIAFDYFKRHKINQEFLQLLLDKDLGVSALDNNGNNIIHQISYVSQPVLSGRVEIDPVVFNQLLKSAISAGVDINLKNTNGKTPLILAAENGNHVIAKSLLEAEANPNILNKEGDSALLVALQNGNERVFNLLKEHGGKAISNEEVEDIELYKAKFNEKILQERKQSWPTIINYWQSFMIAHNEHPKDCEFRLRGGDGSGLGDVLTNLNMNSINIFTRVDAFVFGGCSKARYFHYRVIDKNEKTHAEVYNLSWSHPSLPIMESNGEPHALWFTSPLKGRIEWFSSNEKVKIDDNKIKDNIIKTNDLIVQKNISF